MAAKLKLVLSESSVNVANNTSKVTAKLYYYGNGASYNYNNPSGTITIDGTSYSFNHDFTTSTSAQLLATKSKTVTHNTDGSKTVSVSAKFKTGVSLGTLSTSASKTLTKIARASTLSLNKTSVPADGSTTVTATATKQSSSFTDTLTVIMGDYSQTITSGTAFTIPKEWVNGISGTSATATVKVTTKSGSTTIGSNTKSLTITVPETSEFYPVINDVGISEAVASVTDAFGSLYVRNLSQLNVSVDASGVYGSTIKSYSTSVNGVTYIQQAFTSNVLNVAGDITLTTTVTDSRNRTATATRTINVVDYAMPSITSMTYYPCDDDGNRDSNGTNTKVIISYKVYPVNEQNTKSMKLFYKAMADENYTERALTLTDWEGTVEVIVSGTDASVTYEYIAELTDSINGSNPATYPITTGVVVLSRLAGGKGVTLFGEAEKEGFTVDGEKTSRFTGSVITANGNGIWGYTADGGTRSLLYLGTSGNTVLGQGGYVNNEAATILYGNDIKMTSKTAGLSSRSYGVNKILWSGASYMNASTTITLSEAISAQPHGVVFVWSHYDLTNATVDNHNWNSNFIPKYVVANHQGTGHDCVVSSAGSIYHKYLYISDTSITGYSKNNNSSASFHGETLDFRYFVLRYVLGV